MTNVEIKSQKLSFTQLMELKTAVLDPMCFQIICTDDMLDDSEANSDENKRLVGKDFSSK